MSPRLAFPSEHDVDDGKGNREIELQHGRGADRSQIAGCEVGFFREALQKLAKGEMLGGNQAAVENDAQVAADGGGEIAGKIFVKLVDGAQLLASDLSGLADVPGLDDRAGGGGTRHCRCALSGPCHRFPAWLSTFSIGPLESSVRTGEISGRDSLSRKTRQASSLRESFRPLGGSGGFGALGARARRSGSEN